MSKILEQALAITALQSYLHHVQSKLRCLNPREWVKRDYLIPVDQSTTQNFIPQSQSHRVEIQTGPTDPFSTLATGSKGAARAQIKQQDSHPTLVTGSSLKSTFTYWASPPKLECMGLLN